MKSMSSIVTRFALGAAALFFGACGGSNTDAADNTDLEPTRETRIQDLAEDACDRYETCTGYGSDKTYSSESECRSDFTSKAGTLWPDDKCNRGQINNARYEQCVSATQNVACSGNIFDAISALDDCKASTVCTDAPM
jgi:hypothetical protein